MNWAQNKRFEQTNGTPARTLAPFAAQPQRSADKGRAVNRNIGALIAAAGLIAALHGCGQEPLPEPRKIGTLQNGLHPVSWTPSERCVRWQG
jgi:hypothetical protein